MFLMQLKDYRSHLVALAKSALGLKSTPELQNQTGGQGLTFVVNKSHIVKFALKQDEVEPLQNMVALLNVLRPYLQDKTPVRVPNVHGISLNMRACDVRSGKEAQIYAAVYPMIQGTFHRKPTFAGLNGRDCLMEQLGEFIGHLHGFDYRKYPQLNLPDYKSCLTQDMAGIVEELEYEKDSFKKRLLNGVCKQAFGASKSVLCHYDAMPRNICLNADATRITGIIDFGSVLIAPRAFETTNTDYTKEDLKALEKGYARITRRSILTGGRDTPQGHLVKTVCDLYAQMKYG